MMSGSNILTRCQGKGNEASHQHYTYRGARRSKDFERESKPVYHFSDSRDMPPKRARPSAPIKVSTIGKPGPSKKRKRTEILDTAAMDVKSKPHKWYRNFPDDQFEKIMGHDKAEAERRRIAVEQAEAAKKAKQAQEAREARRVREEASASYIYILIDHQEGDEPDLKFAFKNREAANRALIRYLKKSYPDHLDDVQDVGVRRDFPDWSSDVNGAQVRTSPDGEVVYRFYSEYDHWSVYTKRMRLLDVVAEGKKM